MSNANLFASFKRSKETETLPVVIDGTTHQMNFRVLAYVDVDKINLAALGPDGKFSANYAAGNNIRWVVASLIPDAGTVLTFEEVATWRNDVISAIGQAARKANSEDVTTDDAAKNSDGGAKGGG